MGSIQNPVYYCCVWNEGRVLYAYNGGGDDEIEKLAELCLEKAPSHHKWYFQTMFKKTFGFLMEDGYVYFAIVDESLGNPGALKFLEHVRDVAKNGSPIRSVSNPNSLVFHDQLVPVIRGLIASLEHVSNAAAAAEAFPLSPSPTSGQVDTGVSTKAPLLGKCGKPKQEKRKTRDHVISVVVEEHRKSADRGVVKAGSSSLDCGDQDGAVGAISLTKEASMTRSRSSGQSQVIRSKWCRQVRIVLAIDAAVCLTLFVVWIVVCGGTECIS